MSIKYYNQPPYFDDYDKNKGYYRILFRPGVAVQARELTQLQTSIQAQLDRMGSHTFKDGSRVLGGLPTFDTQLDYIKIESSFTYSSTSYNTDNYFDEFVGSVITGLNSGITAEVIDVTAPENGDPITLFVRYKSAGTNNDDQTMLSEEVFQSNGSPQRFGKVQPTVDEPTGFGARVSVAEGVYFVSGCFVYVESQTAIMAKYISKVDARIVYEVTEGIVTEASDPSLVDNALGSPNESAPGAHRYAIKLDLQVEGIDVDQRAKNNIIQLGVINNGIVQEAVRESDYSELMKTVSQRTFEESGNYTVRPFQIDSRDDVNGDPDKFTITLEPSIAYVKGYRISTLAPTEIEAERARESGIFNLAAIQAQLENYIEVDNLVGTPDVDTLNQVDLRDNSNDTIGTARIRSIQYVSGVIGTTAAVYRLYLFDINMLPGKLFAGTYQFEQTNSPTFYADPLVPGSAVLLGAGTNSLIFPLPFNTVNTLRDLGGAVDTLYRSKISFTGTAAGGDVTLTTGTPSVQFYTTTNEDWVCTVVSTGAIIDISGNIDISGGTTAIVSGLDDVPHKFIAPVRKNQTEKTKTLQSDYTFAISPPNTTQGSHDTLDVADVITLKAVYMSSSLATAANTGDVDISDRYTLDGGQRANMYSLGRIRLNQGAIAPTGQLLIVVDYFTHGAGDYFSVDSYSNVDYDDIPEFSSGSGTYNLRDVIDFRPRIGSDGVTFDSAGGSTTDMIKPTSLIDATIQYYLPRRDRLYVDYRGNFKMAKGVPSVDPKYPDVPDDAMPLYDVEINPYTFTPKDMTPKIVDNRRYTMRDIGKIDKRVSNLEYYTSLSLLEKETSDTQLFDSNGERFKNGFIVDGFYGHNVGDVSNPDYAISMDKGTGTLRPHFHEDSVRVVYDASNSSGVVKNGPIVTLPFTEVEDVYQPYASRTENLNPYFVVQYDGNLDISPSSDEWKDTETRPEVVIDQTGAYDAIKFLAEENNILGTEWNEWETNWSGREIVSQSEWGMRVTNRRVDTVQQTEALTSTQQSRNGLRTSLSPDTVTTDLGERVVDINFVPFIRSRKVYFRVERMKPNARCYLFFDGTDISEYARMESTYIEHSNVDGAATFKGATTHPDGSGNLVTDSEGSIIGSFIVPSNDTMKFKTGSRVVRLIDRTDNALDDAGTYAEATYTAQGLLQTKQGTTISTQVPKFEVSEVSDSRIITERVVSTEVIASVTEPRERGNRVDPLAQTFFVDLEGGMFITSLDVFFRTKSSTSPMICQLRTVENGYPTTTVIPFGEKVLKPADVNISEDATAATNVKFNSPVFLNDQTEYCFVLKALDTGYNAWVSELGGFDVTNVDFRITDQPHSGVLFKSANASTWTAEQFKDIKFRINRAQFDTNTSGNLQLQSVVNPTIELSANPFSVYSGSNMVRVKHFDHGLFENSKVEIGNVATSVAGIAASEFNGVHIVQLVEFDSYVISVSSNANGNGRAGGTGITATQNVLANVIYPSISQIQLPDTSANWKMRLLQGQSLANSFENPYTFTSYFDVIANKNASLARVHVVASDTNKEFQSDPNIRPLQLKGTLNTARDNLSPFIDLDRVSVVAVSNRVDNPSDDSSDSSANYIAPDPNSDPRYVNELAARENTTLSRYITRKITLAEAADDLKIFIMANRPSGSSIKVFYRLELDDSQLSDIAWIEAISDGPIVFSEDANKYNEVEYSLNNVGQYTAFAIKIVLTAQNSSNVPTIRDFRAIALSS